jgi:hypothetical protein
MEQKHYLLIGLVLSGILLAFHYLFSGLDNYGRILDILNIVTGAFAAAAAYISYSLCKPKTTGAKAFLFVALAMSLWVLAEVSWAYYEIILGVELPEFSIADLLWLAGYVPYAYAVFLAFEEIRFYISAALISVLSYIVIGAIVAFLLGDLVISSEAEAQLNLLNLLYVLWDTLLLSLSAPLIAAFFLKQTGKTWPILGFSMLLDSVSDLWYFQLVALDLYTASHISNIAYLLGYVWAGVAAMVYLTERRKRI